MDNSENIIIRRTVNGVPEESAAPAEGTRSRGRRASTTGKDSRAKTESVPRAKGDPYIWGIYISLLIFSVLELFSASSSEVSGNNVYLPLIRHGIFLAIGFGIVLWLSRLHYKYISRYARLMALVSLGLLVLSIVAGVEINGAQRAIRILGFTIQPAEIVKLTVIIWLAYILAKNQEPGGVTTKGVFIAAVIVVFFSACLWSNGLTNTLLLMCVSIAMFMIGGIPVKKFLTVLVAYGVCASVLVGVKYLDTGTDQFDRVEQSAGAGQTDRTSRGGRMETHKGRLARHIEGVDPDDPIDDFNRQVIFSKIAQAHGGLLGQGPGNSRESARLPLAFSDYIYGIIIEDTGMVGGIALLILYMWLLTRAGVIAYRCSRAFPAFLILGCAVLISLQALVHMAIVTGIAPVSGQPLPLISKGGTSILVMSAAIGIMLSVSRFAVTNRDVKEERKELRELPEELRSANMATGKS